jgi:hypothetical protein
MRGSWMAEGVNIPLCLVVAHVSISREIIWGRDAWHLDGARSQWPTSRSNMASLARPSGYIKGS